MSFEGMRVMAFESRRAREIAELIRRQQGEPQVAPALREAELDSNDEAFRFGERLAAGEFEMMILLTGVGTRALAKLLEGRYPFVESLRRITVVARGPKPAAALRELQVPVAVHVPEPNTWRELLAAVERRPERRVAVQEYGRPAIELTEGLRARGFEVTSVGVYHYALPADLGPLQDAVRALAEGRADATLFTTAVQIAHLAKVAREMGLEEAALEGVRRTVVASIGPTTTEALEEFGIHPDVVASHPKMGFLLKEAAESARGVLARKRAG
jgi:uroporphyrinogen-III synthase